MKYIKIEKTKERIGILKFNRPEVHNSFSRELLHELTAALKELENDKGIGVIILTGEGEKSFSAGVDLTILQNFKDIEEAREYALLLEGTSENLFNCSKPVITAINGYALGGGMGYAVSTDYRIASENAKIGFPAVRLGAILPVTCTLYLSALIGVNHSRDILLTGRMMTAQDAQTIGLVNKVVPHQDLMEEAKKIAKMMLEGTDMALFYTKKTINTIISQDIEAKKIYAADNFAFLSQTKEWKERILNFGKKK